MDAPAEGLVELKAHILFYGPSVIRSSDVSEGVMVAETHRNWRIVLTSIMLLGFVRMPDRIRLEVNP